MSRPELHPAERPRQRYCFGDYVLDLEAGFLRCRDKEISLRPKSFEVLAYLVRHHGHLVTKTALIEATWPDTAVTDNSLAHCLLEIRRALADDSQQLIRTVARGGTCSRRRSLHLWSNFLTRGPARPCRQPRRPGSRLVATQSSSARSW
ncbi:MAG: winged helix-turn-helix domain-containing protein [Bryobacteraceae bacterium]